MELLVSFILSVMAGVVAYTHDNIGEGFIKCSL